MTHNESLPFGDRLASELQNVAASNKGKNTPALSFAVATTGGLRVCGATGVADIGSARPARTEDQYPWFSMTKIATATAARRLANDGAVDLDATIDNYLPGYESGRYGAPTIRQLLSHTAGLANPLPLRWLRPADQAADAALIDAVTERYGAPRRNPGGRASYSNIGYLLMGQVLEAVTAQPVAAAITDRVLVPLGMTNTGFVFDQHRSSSVGYLRAPRLAHPILSRFLPRGIVGPRVQGYSSFRPFLVEGAAYGGLIGPASDAVKLALAHLSEHSALGDVRDMQEITQRGKPFDHGLGWFRRPADAHRRPGFVEHYGTGGGFWNAMRIYPDLGLALVGMTNNTSTWPYEAFFTDVVHVLEDHNQLTN